MKKFYNLLRIILWSVIGVFIGGSLYKWHDYKVHPGLYAMQSAPWYLSIEINAIFTAVVVTVIIILMWIIRKKINEARTYLTGRTAPC